MLTFFDLNAAADIAAQSRRSDGAALAWQLIGLPTLSAHPAAPDTTTTMVLDERWLTSRWPHADPADVVNDPDHQPYFTRELLPLSGEGEQYTALQAGLDDGWTLLAVDIDDRQVAWYLARSRRLRVGKKLLTAHERTPRHPMLRQLAEAQFTVANVPPGLDLWTAHRSGPRFDVQLTLTMIEVRFDIDGHSGDTSAWTLVFPTAVPPAALAAVATGLSLIPAPGSAAGDR